MRRLLGIDIGTSGAKALLIDESGRVLSSASAEYPLFMPQPGWAEQQPDDWWRATLKCVREIGEPKPDAIGLSGQMHGAVFLDGRGESIRPAILWCDQRTADECDEIDRVVGRERLRAITKNPPLTGFQAPKLLWLRNHELSRYQMVRSLLLPKDFIRFRMTGERATDASDASGSGLLDVGRRGWSQEMLAAMELDPAFFPRVAESHELTGVTRGVEGLTDGIPVVAGAGDQAAAAVGTGAVTPGALSISLGTSGVAFAPTDMPEADPSGSAHLFCHANGGWHAMGVMLSCGAAVRWARSLLFPGGDYSEMTTSAEAAPPGCEGLTFLPYLSGERCPFVDPHARGAWIGLTLSHGRAHIARSVFEGVTFGLVDCVERLDLLGASADEARVTGGGARNAFWLQMLADALGKPVSRLAVDEGPAFGAALLAGVGIGVWSSVAESCSQTVRVNETFEPSGQSYAEPLARYRSARR